MREQGDLRVLVDLSLAVLGYSGIPQEARLVFQALTEANLDTTALLFPVGDASLPSRPSRNSLARRCEYQAQVLHALVHGAPGRSSGWWKSLSAGWSAVWDTFRSRLGWAETPEPLDSETFWDVFWRRWLSASLPDEERSLARRPACFSRMTRATLNRRARYGLPGPRLDTRGHDFALFHEARPVRISRGTCKIVRHYDLIPVVRPDLVTSPQQIEVQARGIEACRHDAVFTCISEAVRQDLIRLYPELAERAVTIPCTLTAGYYPVRNPRLVPTLVANHLRTSRRERLSEMPPYLLCVGTIEPRKNHRTLLRAFEQVLAARETDLVLVVVGSLGWHWEEILRAMEAVGARGRLYHLEQVPLPEMRVLYSEARAVIFPSLYEGFGYPPLEAMRCGTPVIASDIAAHRAVHGDAVHYCDPYAVDSVAAAIEAVCLDLDDAARADLVARGHLRARRYSLSATSAQWRALLTELRRQGITHNVADARLARFNEELQAIGAAHEPLDLPRAA